MTVRHSKWLLILAIALMVVAAGLELFLGLTRPGRSVNYVQLALPLLFAIIFSGTWRRLSKLEAEHGPDYAPPNPPYARKVMIGAGLVAAVLAGLLAYLIAIRG